jgi:probable F420-dependent oxidoreductase
MSELSLAVQTPVANQMYADHELHRVVDLARMADDAGVGTVLVVDHVVMGNRPDRYLWGKFSFPADASWMEPLTVLAAMAAATSRVELATSILIAPLRPATLLAKTAATLDVLSQGRLELGVGTGWQAEEYEAEGLDFSARGQALTDTVAACRALWARSPADFSSATVSFQDVWCDPKPVRAGGPRILFSGTLTRRNVDRITSLGDGWIPIMGATVDDVGEGVEVLREACRSAGRDPATLKIRAPLPIVRAEDGKADLDATLEGAPALAKRGVTEVAISVVSWTRDPDAAPAWFDRVAKRWAALAG